VPTRRPRDVCAPSAPSRRLRPGRAQPAHGSVSKVRTVGWQTVGAVQ